MNTISPKLLSKFSAKINELLDTYKLQLLSTRQNKLFYLCKNFDEFRNDYNECLQGVLKTLMTDRVPNPLKVCSFYKDVDTISYMEQETYSQRPLKLTKEIISEASMNLVTYESTGQYKSPCFSLELSEKIDYEREYYYRLPVTQRNFYTIYKSKNVDLIKSSELIILNNNPFFTTQVKKNKQVPEIRNNNKERYRYKMEQVGNWLGYRFNRAEGVKPYEEPLYIKKIISRF